VKRFGSREAGIPRRGRSSARQGSGLIIVLSILAMLAIMATTFITLMRLDARITANYVDDLRCEMLARGVMNYFFAVLRDDLDRTWEKYENRDASVGMIGWDWPGVTPTVRVPGLNTLHYGTGVGNDCWYNPPYKGAEWTSNWGGLFESMLSYECLQQSFACALSVTTGVMGRYYDAPSRREVDIYMAHTLVDFDSQHRIVYRYHPDARGGIDFDGDGEPYGTYRDAAFDREESAVRDWYYDTAPFVLFAGDTYFESGETLTGTFALPGGTFWRWAVKLGVPQDAYINLNTAGNLDGRDAAYLNNMGGIGLGAQRVCDQTESQVVSDHLGRIAWKGFPGEFHYSLGGFPRFYNEVSWHPAQISLERLFMRDSYAGMTIYPPDDRAINLKIDRAKARKLIAYRLGDDGKPGDGGERYRVGWRRDGATYYRFVSPDFPVGDSRFFGANEVMEHDRSVGHPWTSAVINKLAEGAMEGGMNFQDAVKQAQADWRKLRPYLTMRSTDTILRGKIWPTEGWLPWRTTATPGDWRHIDILKRININLVGARGPEGLPGEDASLKTRWAAKRQREQDRLYFMLVAGLRFSNTPNPQQKACQFIASLADMVDRDQNETYYAAPDGSGMWALGVEKHPVINEVVFYSNSAANTAAYELSGLRVELYNPMENIPWIPDADEAYDVSDYVLRIGSHNYRLGDLVRYTTDPNAKYSDALPGNVSGAVRTIGADGIYGYPQPVNVTTHPTWSRYMHLGWPTGGFPPGLTRGELEGGGFSGVEVSLWKPLSPDAVTWPGLATDILGRVETINGRKCLCVDRTGNVKLVRPWDTTKGENGPGQIVNDTDWDDTRTNPDPALNRNMTTYLGIYRRWDPMNAPVYTRAGNPGGVTYGKNEQCGVVWCPGWTLGSFPRTLGKPNDGYPAKPYSTSPPGTTSSYKYQRMFEREFKVVDGDLPTIGWLGELMLWNCAQDGPLTWVHAGGQPATQVSYRWVFANELDVKAKFDLFRPFRPAGVYNPFTGNCRTENLQMLDIFTVWDPSNDGLDNDGDGAVDDEDTGCQAQDRCGPEVRVFGKIDLNQTSQISTMMGMPDNKYVSTPDQGPQRFCSDLKYNRSSTRGNGDWRWGPWETIGDLLRADNWTYAPGTYFSVGTAYEDCATNLSEGGLTPVNTYNWTGDDDGDGIYDERDERDMLFSWIANYFTTRSNVFEIDLSVDICERPYYPERSGVQRRLPCRTYRTRRSYARKELLGILDRSTCLRVAGDGRCDFSGPIDVRMFRFTDDKRVN